jgi:hypothetical protein
MRRRSGTSRERATGSRPVSDMLVEVGDTAATARRPPPSHRKDRGRLAAASAIGGSDHADHALDHREVQIAISTARSAGWRLHELESASAALGVQLFDRHFCLGSTVCMFGRLRSAAMPIRMVFPSPIRPPHADSASAPRPRPAAMTRSDHLLGRAMDRVCDLMTPGGGWHFEDEVPDRSET